MLIRNLVVVIVILFAITTTINAQNYSSTIIRNDSLAESGSSITTDQVEICSSYSSSFSANVITPQE